MAGRYDNQIKALRLLVVEAETERSIAPHLTAADFTDVTSCDSLGRAAALFVKDLEAGRGFDVVFLEWALFERMRAERVQAWFDSPRTQVFALIERELEEALHRRLEDAGCAAVIHHYDDSRVLVARAEILLLNHYLSREVRLSDRKNQRLFLNILQFMAKTMEAKDPYTRSHSENVADHAFKIAQRLGYDEEHLERIAMAGVLHDFGKVGIREDILNKPAALTAGEYRLVQNHPLIASTILEPIEELKDIIADIRHHHERFDGTGYPDGLAGEKIPLGARILAVAEAYDTMVYERTYRAAQSHHAACEELRKGAGTQFDPQVVHVFLETLAEQEAEQPTEEPETETSETGSESDLPSSLETMMGRVEETRRKPLRPVTGPSPQSADTKKTGKHKAKNKKGKRKKF